MSQNRNGDGTITKEELREVLNQLGESPTEKELTAMFKLVFSLILNNKHSYNNVLDYKVFSYRLINEQLYLCQGKFIISIRNIEWLSSL